MYTPTNGLNKLLHEYVKSHFELFNAQTGPNWLVAVVEDINRQQAIGDFSRRTFTTSLGIWALA